MLGLVPCMVKLRTLGLHMQRVNSAQQWLQLMDAEVAAVDVHYQREIRMTAE